MSRARQIPLVEPVETNTFEELLSMVNRYADQYTGANEDRLARLYHAHHSRHLEDLDFWLDLAAQQRGPILELGCGTGRVLIPLAAAGHAVYGLDYSAAMLRVLKENLPPDLEPRVHLLQADLAAFRLARSFALILLPCNTYSTLSDAARGRCLERVRQHLAPGGLFVASMPNPEQLSRLPAHGSPEVEEVFLDARSGDPIQVSSSWQRRAGQAHMTWHYDQLSSDGHVHRLNLDSIHHIRHAAAYSHDLQAAGLTPTALYGDFDRSPHTPTSPLLILTAKR